jgi:hypothetical protein
MEETEQFRLPTTRKQHEVAGVNDAFSRFHAGGGKQVEQFRGGKHYERETDWQQKVAGR